MLGPVAVTVKVKVVDWLTADGVDRTGESEGSGLDDVDGVADGDGIGGVGGWAGGKRGRVRRGGGSPDAVLIELQPGRYGGAWDVLDSEDAVVGGGEVIGNGIGVVRSATEVETGGVGCGEGDGADVVLGDGVVGVVGGKYELDSAAEVDGRRVVGEAADGNQPEVTEGGVPHAGE